MGQRAELRQAGSRLRRRPGPAEQERTGRHHRLVPARRKESSQAERRVTFRDPAGRRVFLYAFDERAYWDFVGCEGGEGGLVMWLRQ